MNSQGNRFDPIKSSKGIDIKPSQKMEILENVQSQQKK